MAAWFHPNHHSYFLTDDPLLIFQNGNKDEEKQTVASISF